MTRDQYGKAASQAFHGKRGSRKTSQPSGWGAKADKSGGN